MKIINQRIILFFCILLTFGFQCNEDEDEQFENIFELELPFKITPVQKEYKINDTIQISCFIKDRSLKDLNSQNEIELVCTDIPMRFYVGLRYSNTNLIDADKVFDVIIDTINFQDYQIENNGQNSRFEANISEDIFDRGEISIMKIIPKKIGVYMANPNLYRDLFINRVQDCNETNPMFDKGIMNHVFDVLNTNPELIDESPLPHTVFISGDRVPRKTEEKRIFWFKVIE